MIAVVFGLGAIAVVGVNISKIYTIDMREGVPGGANALAGTAKWQEWRRLKKAGPGENLGMYEETVEDRVFSFKRERYYLSDGTEVVFSVGYPKDDQ